MENKPPISPESAERLRELYRKNLLAAIVLTPDSLANDYPELAQSVEQPKPSHNTLAGAHPATGKGCRETNRKDQH